MKLNNIIIDIKTRLFFAAPHIAVNQQCARATATLGMLIQLPSLQTVKSILMRKEGYNYRRRPAGNNVRSLCHHLSHRKGRSHTCMSASVRGAP